MENTRESLEEARAGVSDVTKKLNEIQEQYKEKQSEHTTKYKYVCL